MNKPSKCDYCEYPTWDLKERASSTLERGFPDSTKGTKWLCDLCSATLGQNEYEPRDKNGNRDVLRAISYVGNQIIWEIKRAEENLKNK
jgi:hypothetical protein